MYGRISERVNAFCAMTIVLLLCALPFACTGNVKRCIDVRPYSTVEAQQVRLNVELRGKIVRLEEVSHYCDSVYEIMRADPITARQIANEHFHGPKLILTLVNDSKRDFMVPPCRYDSYGWDLPSGVSLELGGDSLRRCPIIDIPELDYYSDCGKFVELKSGNSLAVSDTIDIFYYYDAESPTAGNYWVRVHFWNYLWYDNLPPVWIGETWSDTLRFEIVAAR